MQKSNFLFRGFPQINVFSQLLIWRADRVASNTVQFGVFLQIFWKETVAFIKQKNLTLKKELPFLQTLVPSYKNIPEAHNIKTVIVVSPLRRLQSWWRTEYYQLYCSKRSLFNILTAT